MNKEVSKSCEYKPEKSHFAFLQFLYLELVISPI